MEGPCSVSSSTNHVADRQDIIDEYSILCKHTSDDNKKVQCSCYKGKVQKKVALTRTTEERIGNATRQSERLSRRNSNNKTILEHITTSKQKKNRNKQSITSVQNTKLRNVPDNVMKECLYITKEASYFKRNDLFRKDSIFDELSDLNSTSLDRVSASQDVEAKKNVVITSAEVEKYSHLLEKFESFKKANETTPKKQITIVPETPVKINDHLNYSKNKKSRHICEFCQKCFKSNGKLNNHRYSHTGERPFKCRECGKAFSSKFKLVRHLLIHSEVRKFVCQICDRTFLRNDHLKNHFKIHDPMKKLHKCDRTDCNKEYSSLLSYKKHMAVHFVDDGHLVCYICKQTFETKEEIQFHLKTHSGSRLFKSQSDKKFKCQYCERLFLTKKDVTRHLVVHTGNRDFLCQFCPQRFGRKDHLVRHIKKSHSDGLKVENKIESKVKNKDCEEKTTLTPTQIVIQNVPNILIIPTNSILVLNDKTCETKQPAFVYDEDILSPDMYSNFNYESYEQFNETNASPEEKEETKVKIEDLSELSMELNSIAQLPDKNDLIEINCSIDMTKDMLLGNVQEFDPLDSSCQILDKDENFEQDSPSTDLLKTLLIPNDDVMTTPLPGFSQIFHSPPTAN